jgi:hypothetical protein
MRGEVVADGIFADRSAVAQTGTTRPPRSLLALHARLR